MKKILLLAILLQWFFIGCSRTDNKNFYRIPLPRDSKDNPYSGSRIFSGFNGKIYYSHSIPNATTPYFGSSPSFTFLCPRTKYTGFYVSLDSEIKDKLQICIETPTGKIHKNFPLKKGINEIILMDNFSANDKITLATESSNPFVLANPIFFNILPNMERNLIFLISVDTLAASHMSLYGYEKETTPNLTRFAQDAVLFDHAFSNSTWTVSSHMSLFTSLLEYGHKVNVKKTYIKSGNNPFTLKTKLIFSLSPDIPLLTEYLRDNYLTYSFNGGGNVSREFGFFGGFDAYLSNNKDMNDPQASKNLFDKVKSHLEKLPVPNVFYFLHTYHVHAPYNPRPEFLAKEEPNPELTTFDYYTDLGGIRAIYKPYQPGFVKDVIKLYDAEIKSFDSSFGDFIAYLKTNNLYDQALIILLSDHGEEFLEHGSWVHASDLYKEQTWIPLLMKFPFQEHSGKIIHMPVSLVDVMPTLLDYKGLEIPGHLHGRSLLNLINGKEHKNIMTITSLFRSKPEIYSPGKIAVIQNNFKLIYSEPYPPTAHEFFNYSLPKFDTFELYDLSADPFEKTNILNFQRNNTTVKQMFKKITDIIRAAQKSFDNQTMQHSKPLPEELENQLKTLGYF